MTTPSPSVGDIWTFLGNHFLVLAVDRSSYLCYCLEDSREDYYLMVSDSWRFVA